MAEYDPDSLNESAEESEISGHIEAEITDVEVKSAVEIFGEDTKSEPDKEMLEVTAESDQLNDPVESVYATPESDQSWLNPRFKLERFRSKYGGVPEEGMTVFVEPNDSGFMDISIPSVAVESED